MRSALVVIPTYNEAQSIGELLTSLKPLDCDVLVIDDGSPDGTAQKVEELQNEFEGKLFIEKRSGKLGLGTAYIHGFKWALAKNYTYIFEMDCDFLIIQMI